MFWRPLFSFCFLHSQTFHCGSHKADSVKRSKNDDLRWTNKSKYSYIELIVLPSRYIKNKTEQKQNKTWQKNQNQSIKTKQTKKILTNSHLLYYTSCTQLPADKPEGVWSNTKFPVEKKKNESYNFWYHTLLVTLNAVSKISI